MKRFLITLTAPLAVRLDDGSTRLSNVVEAAVIDAVPVNSNPGMLRLRISAVWDSKADLMTRLARAVDVVVKTSNIRSRQEVA